jgi:DnaJ-class molecular chaperone
MNPYQLLSINHNATKDEIKNAYKKLALRWHPDRNITNQEEASKKFKEIQEAYDTLTNPKYNHNQQQPHNQPQIKLIHLPYRAFYTGGIIPLSLENNLKIDISIVSGTNFGQIVKVYSPREKMYRTFKLLPIPETNWERKNANLHYYHTIKANELNHENTDEPFHYNLNLRHISGKKYNFSLILKNISEQVKTFKKKGMTSKGNLIIHIKMENTENTEKIKLTEFPEKNEIKFPFFNNMLNKLKRCGFQS